MVINVNIIINFKLLKNFDSLMEERRTAQISDKKMKESDTKFLVKKTKPNIRIDDIIFTRGSTLCTGEFPKIYLPNRIIVFKFSVWK